MTKLEELKAAIANYEYLNDEYHKTAKIIGCDEARNLYFLSYNARIKKEALRDELLPHLIAVAEAAKAAHNRWESVDWKAEPTAGFMNTLRDALLPLTKDADK